MNTSSYLHSIAVSDDFKLVVSKDAQHTIRAIVNLNSLFIETLYDVLPSIDDTDTEDIKEHFQMLQSRLISCLDLQLNQANKTEE